MKKSFLCWIFVLSLSLLFLGEHQNVFASGDIKVLGSLTQEKVVGGGESYNGAIIIKNAGGSPCKVKIYQTDYLFYADGSNSYGLPGSNPLSNAKWVALSTAWVTVPAGQTAPVNYSVQVPKNPDLRGTYWSLIMVEPVEAAGDNPGVKGKYVLGLQTSVRYGVQIITDIKDTGTRSIAFLNKKISAENGNKVFQFDIKNTGERWLNPTVLVQLYNKNGKSLGTFGSEKKRIFPTCSVRHKILLPDIPKGEYKAVVIVDNGDQYVFGANYEMIIQ